LKNIIVLLLDAMRFDHITQEITPNLLRIAEKGIYYDKCMSGGTSTLDSMPVLLCGLKKYDPSLSLMARLRRKGYWSMLIHSNPILGKNFSEGWDSVTDLKERDWGQRRVGLRRVIRKWIPHFALRLIRGLYRWLQREEGYLPYARAGETLTAAKNILESLEDTQLFLWVHLMDPHIPYYPQNCSHPDCPKTHDEIADINDKLVDAVHGRYNPTLKEVETYKLLYRLEVSEMDKAIGSFYDSIDWSNSLLIITSDHGDEFGEAGQFSHHSEKFIPCLQHVPLIILGLGKERIKNEFSHFDLNRPIFDWIDDQRSKNH